MWIGQPAFIYDNSTVNRLIRATMIDKWPLKIDISKWHLSHRNRPNNIPNSSTIVICLNWSTAARPFNAATHPLFTTFEVLFFRRSIEITCNHMSPNWLTECFKSVYCTQFLYWNRLKLQTHFCIEKIKVSTSWPWNA